MPGIVVVHRRRRRRRTAWAQAVAGLLRCGGFTLVELLVSIIVLTVGLLALTGASAVVARQLSGGAQMALAATIAQSRFEALRARDCSALESGSSEDRGIAEAWSVARRNRTAEIIDTVTLAARSGSRVHVFRSAIPCPEAP